MPLFKSSFNLLTTGKAAAASVAVGTQQDSGTHKPKPVTWLEQLQTPSLMPI